MSLTADMEGICNGIRHSHKDRRKFLHDCFNASHEILSNARNFMHGVHAEGEKRAKDVRSLLNRFHGEQNEIAQYVAKLAKETKAFLGAFNDDRKGMHQAWARCCAAAHREEPQEQPKAPKKKKK